MTATNVIKMSDPLYLEAEELPQPLFALLYFNNGKRLQILSDKGEVATLNLSKADDNGYILAQILCSLWIKHGNILIRGEHIPYLPSYLQHFFKPMEGGDK